MRVGLFIPCYVDQFYPDVGMATLELLGDAAGTARASTIDATVADVWPVV